MKKYALFFAAMAVVIGCGGSGGGGSTTGSTGTTGTTTGSVMSVNLPNVPGRVSFFYFTGTGRAISDATAEIDRASLPNGTPNPPETVLQPVRSLSLGNYTSQSISVDVPIGVTGSNLYETLLIHFSAFEFSDGSRLGFQDATFPDSSLDGPGSPKLNARAFVGRQTVIPMYVSPLMFDVVSGSGGSTVVLDRDVFRAFNNISNDGSKLNGYLSDFLSFDVRGLAKRPKFSTGEDADTVHFSGDYYAASIGGTEIDQTNGRIEIPNAGLLEGVLAGPATLPGSGGTTTTGFGTYYTKQPDPNSPDPNNPNKITAATGIWRYHTQLLNNIGPFEVLTMPSNNDDNKQTILAWVTGAGGVTELYFGGDNILPGTGVDLVAGTFVMVPISQFGRTSPINAEALTGTVTDLKMQNGQVRSGTYTFKTASLPAGFEKTGKFLVFRR